MKKLLILSTCLPVILFAGQTYAKSLDEYRFNSSDISISFKDDKATLSTKCYDAVGIYNATKKENSLKINFALQDYVNVKNCSKYESEQAKIALHTLAFNESVNFKFSNDFLPLADFYSDQGSIMSFNVSKI